MQVILKNLKKEHRMSYMHNYLSLLGTAIHPSFSRQTYKRCYVPQDVQSVNLGWENDIIGTPKGARTVQSTTSAPGAERTSCRTCAWRTVARVAAAAS